MVVLCHTIPYSHTLCFINSPGADSGINFPGGIPVKKYILRFWPLYLFVVVLMLLVLVSGNHMVTTLAEMQPIYRKQVIIIDPGHGGEDGGALSCTGAYESNINLEIALRLNDLCHLMGFETLMVRTTDVSIYTQGTTLAAKKASDLKNRVKMVNNTTNALLISIHQNTYSDSRYTGAQVFYANTNGSFELAQKLQTQITTIDANNHRRVKQADHVYLMKHIEKTGILVECGFLSNPIEEAKLRSDAYQKMLCAAIVTVLSGGTT